MEDRRAVSSSCRGRLGGGELNIGLTSLPVRLSRGVGEEQNTQVKLLPPLLVVSETAEGELIADRGQ